MPLDSRDKRASAIGVGFPVRTLLPVPDPDPENQGDRQQVSYAYRGINAGGVVAEAETLSAAVGGAILIYAEASRRRKRAEEEAVIVALSDLM